MKERYTHPRDSYEGIPTLGTFMREYPPWEAKEGRFIPTLGG